MRTTHGYFDLPLNSEEWLILQAQRAVFENPVLDLIGIKRDEV
jgi:hypothetical protein